MQSERTGNTERGLVYWTGSSRTTLKQSGLSASFSLILVYDVSVHMLSAPVTVLFRIPPQGYCMSTACKGGNREGFCATIEFFSSTRMHWSQGIGVDIREVFNLLYHILLQHRFRSLTCIFLSGSMVGFCASVVADSSVQSSRNMATRRKKQGKWGLQQVWNVSAWDLKNEGTKWRG